MPAEAALPQASNSQWLLNTFLNTSQLPVAFEDPCKAVLEVHRLSQSHPGDSGADRDFLE